METLFDEDGLKIIALGPDGPRGARVRFELAGEHVDVIEGVARRAGLRLRQYVRRQKTLRGDTPRGMKAYLAAKEDRHGSAAR